jgi:hypothetical protein
VSERKSDEREVVEEAVKRREKGLRDRVKVGMCGRRWLRSRLERIMLSKRVIEARFGVIAVEDDDDIGAGAVCSRSEMNSLKAMTLVSPVIIWNIERSVLALCLLEYSDVIGVFVRQASQEVIHFEVVDHPIFPLIRCWGLHILPIRVEQAGETPCERRTQLLRVESRRTDIEEFVCTLAVDSSTTS